MELASEKRREGVASMLDTMGVGSIRGFLKNMGAQSHWFPNYNKQFWMLLGYHFRKPPYGRCNPVHEDARG
jgi:hypothetical protein